MNPSAPRRSWPWLFIFAGLFLLVFHRFWTHTITASDAFNFFAPNKAILLRGLREGTIYGWNPWLFLGLPFTAEAQAGVYYPLNLLFLVFDFGLAHRLYILLHYPLAAFSFFLLARRLGLGTAAAATGAVAFALSGYLVSQHALVRMTMGAAWAPLVFYFALRAEDGHWKFAAAAGAGLALQVLAGDPETAIVTAAIAGGRLIVFGADSGRWLRAAGLLATMAASAFLLSAAQVLPTWEMMRQSTRAGGLAAAEMQGFSLHPAQLLEFIWPTPYGLSWPLHYYWGRFMLDASFTNIPWSASNYLGLPALVLAAVGLAAGRRPLRFWLLAGTGLFLLLALGRYTPVYGLLAHVPMFNAFRYPSKYVAWLTLCLCLAAALGAERALAWFDEKPERAATVGMIYGAGTVALAVAAYFGWPALMKVKSPFPDNGQLYVDGLRHLLLSWSQWAGINAAIALVLFIVFPRARRVALAAIAGLIIFDLYLGNVAIMPAGPADTYAFEPLAATAIHADGEPFGSGRVYRQDWNFRDRNPADRDPARYARQARWQRTTLRRNHSAASGIEDAVTYGSYELRDGLGLFNHGMAPQILALFNVRYLILSPDAKAIQSVPTKTIHVDRLNDFRVDRMEEVTPRAFFVPGARRAADEAEAMGLLKSIDLKREVVITGGAEVAPAAADSGGIKAAKMLSYAPDRVTIEIEAPNAGWLVLNDRDYPGWAATVDGAPAEVRRANVLVRAVAVGPGRHKVEFSFRPALVRVGAWISGLAWIGMIIIFIVRGKKTFTPMNADGR